MTEQEYDELWNEYRALGAAQPADFETFLVAEVMSLRAEICGLQEVVQKGAWAAETNQKLLDAIKGHRDAV